LHPRTRERLRAFGLEERLRNDREIGVVLTGALGYLDFLCLIKNADLVVTDSGGIQEETSALGVPCVTVRNNTERPVTLENGANILAGTGRDAIAAAVAKQWGQKRRRRPPKMWDGHAAERIVAAMYETWTVRAGRRPAVVV
jgi:UDP-N-acetylglucosamine 2-epimerase (non-hydrolysing)